MKTKNNNLSRFAEIARLDEVVFHAGDLANLWRITNKNTLYTTIKRYIQKGLLFRIYKGFYSIKKPEKIDPFLLGLKALHCYGYVSAETILSENGIIQQDVPAITLVSGISKRFSVAGREYRSRKLPDAFLYQEKGIVKTENGVFKATAERAIADLLYFNPRAYFDAAEFINWKSARALQKELGYPRRKFSGLTDLDEMRGKKEPRRKSYLTGTASKRRVFNKADRQIRKS